MVTWRPTHITVLFLRNIGSIRNEIQPEGDKPGIYKSEVKFKQLSWKS
jgi:hypothetical protein